MGNINYAQLNQNNICTGISSLSGEVPEYNYSNPEIYDPITDSFIQGESKFISRMVPIKVYSESYIGLHYTDNGEWEKIE